MLQDYIVYLILCLTIVFAVYRAIKKSKAAKNGACIGCDGCPGCALHPNKAPTTHSAVTIRSNAPPSCPLRHDAIHSSSKSCHG